MDMGVGDAFEVEDDDPDNEEPEKEKKKRGGGAGSALPVLEGPETVEGFLMKFKKACLSKRSLLKEVRDRLESENCATHRKLDCKRLYVCDILAPSTWWLYKAGFGGH